MLGRAAGQCGRRVPREGHDVAKARFYGTRQRGRALTARAAERPGPGGPEGDRPARPADCRARRPSERLREVTGRGRRGCLRLLGPVSLVALRSRGGGRGRWAQPSAFVSPRSLVSGRMVSLLGDGVRAGIPDTPAASPAAQPSFPGKPLPLPCTVRKARIPGPHGGGRQPASSESPDAFLKRIKRHRDVQKSQDRFAVLLGRDIHSFFSPSNVHGVSCWERSPLPLARSLVSWR